VPHQHGPRPPRRPSDSNQPRGESRRGGESGLAHQSPPLCHPERSRMIRLRFIRRSRGTPCSPTPARAQRGVLCTNAHPHRPAPGAGSSIHLLTTKAGERSVCPRIVVLTTKAGERSVCPRIVPDCPLCHPERSRMIRLRIIRRSRRTPCSPTPAPAQRGILCTNAHPRYLHT
jgi:hypothetical protein